MKNRKGRGYHIAAVQRRPRWPSGCPVVPQWPAPQWTEAEKAILRERGLMPFTEVLALPMYEGAFVDERLN